MQVSNLIQSGSGIQPPVGTATVNGSTEQVSNTTSPSDTLSIASNKIQISQQIVTQQIEIALEIKSPVNSVSQNNDDDHDARLVNEVVKKIHDEKASNTKNVTNEESHQAAVKSVSVKVAQGFQSAKVSLNNLGIVDNAVETSIEQTRTRIDAAINQIPSTVTGEAGNAAVPAEVETTTFNSVSATRDLTSSFQITTKEGDVVTLDFSRSQSITAGSVEGSEGSIVYAGSASSTQLDFSVQGELSEDESESIKEVVENINELAKKLFKGKIGAAMEKLGELKIDTEYLAGMSLSMSSSISYQAVSAYTQVSRIPGEGTQVNPDLAQSGTTTPPVQAPVNNNADNSQVDPAITATGPVDTQNTLTEPAVVQVARETSELVDKTIASDIFKNPFGEIRSMFAQIVDMFSIEQSDTGDDHKDFVSKLFEDIVDKLEENHHDNHDDDSDEDVDDLAA
jgi:hypothetical protein